MKDVILVIGSSGQIGTELVLELKKFTETTTWLHLIFELHPLKY